MEPGYQIAVAALFTCIALAAYVVVWWIVRPLTCVYRIDDGKLVVRSFLIWKSAVIDMSEIGRTGIITGRDLPSHFDKPSRWLTPQFWLPSSRFLMMEAKGQIYVMRCWNSEWVLSSDQAGALEHAKSRRWMKHTNNLSLLLGKVINKNNLRRIVHLRSNLPALARNLGSRCARFSRAAAICLVIFPLWLTAVDLAGVNLLAREYGVSRTLILQDFSYSHFASSAFLLICGAACMAVIFSGRRLPLLFGLIGIFASVSRASTLPTHAHELSHALFDSCEGYDDKVMTIATVSLVASGVLTLASWASRQSQVPSGLFDAAAP